MQRRLSKNGDSIDYILKRSLLFRRLRIVVRPSGVVVTSPYIISESKIEDFIVSKFSWIQDKLDYYKKNPHKIIVKHSQSEIQEYKKKANDYTHERLQHWNKFYNFTYRKVTIKNITSRWGSCSSKGNLNFNYKIVLLSEELADYIIVHELCHLEEMNHGKKFWALVSKTFPHHKELRKQLKKVS